MLKLESSSPRMHVLSRRGFLAACAAVAISRRGSGEQPSAVGGVRFAFDAPHPAHNPAFNYGETQEGELLVWLSGSDDSFEGYRLNKEAYRFWKCFDGNTPITDAVQKVSERMGVAEKDMFAFAQSLEEHKLLVRQGEVVLGEGMELPPEGSCFYADVQFME